MGLGRRGPDADLCRVLVSDDEAWEAMMTVPVEPGLWWALVNRNGDICDLRRTRREVIDEFMEQFPLLFWEPWENIRRRLGLSIQRVIVQAPEAER
jgi:hypothetical protein